jgi:hypothetical protein
MLKEMMTARALPGAQDRSCPVKSADFPPGKAREFTRPG